MYHVILVFTHFATMLIRQGDNHITKNLGEISGEAKDELLGALTEKNSNLCKVHVSLDGREVEWRIN